MSAPTCGAWNGPHDCHQEPDHRGDHFCAGCGDLWNRDAVLDAEAGEWEWQREHEWPEEERCYLPGRIQTYRLDRRCPACGEESGLFRPRGQSEFGIARGLPPRTTWYCNACGGEGPSDEVARLRDLIDQENARTTLLQRLRQQRHPTCEACGGLAVVQEWDGTYSCTLHRYHPTT